MNYVDLVQLIRGKHEVQDKVLNFDMSLDATETTLENFIDRFSEFVGLEENEENEKNEDQSIITFEESFSSLEKDDDQFDIKDVETEINDELDDNIVEIGANERTDNLRKEKSFGEKKEQMEEIEAETEREKGNTQGKNIEAFKDINELMKSFSYSLE
jgi:hypothetical protein